MKTYLLLAGILFFTSCVVVNHVVGEALYDTHWVSVRNRSDSTVTVHYYPEENKSERAELCTVSNDGISMKSLDTAYDAYVFEYSHITKNDTIDCSGGVTLRLFNSFVIPVLGNESDSEEE